MIASEEWDFPKDNHTYPRYSGILSHGNHTVPNTEGTQMQQAGGSPAEARGILETVLGLCLSWMDPE